MSLRIRRAESSDIEACGRILFEAFQEIALRHGFPPDVPTVESGVESMRRSILHPMMFGVVAENEGEVIGSNFLREIDPIRGVVPITVDPRVQLRGVGRALMEAVLHRARDAVGVRLVQDAYNTASMSSWCATVGSPPMPPRSLDGSRHMASGRRRTTWKP